MSRQRYDYARLLWIDHLDDGLLCSTGRVGQQPRVDVPSLGHGRLNVLGTLVLWRQLDARRPSTISSRQRIHAGRANQIIHGPNPPQVCAQDAAQRCFGVFADHMDMSRAAARPSAPLHHRFKSGHQDILELELLPRYGRAREREPLTIPSDLSGMFWFPDSPDAKIPGHLLTSSQQLRLELHGSFVEFEGIVGSPPATYPLMWGVGQSSQDLTLYRCYTSGGHVGGFLEQHLSVSLVFVGAHLSERDLEFTEVEFVTDHLRDWAPSSGIVHMPPAQGFRWQGGLRKPEFVVADLGDGRIVKVGYESRIHIQPNAVDLGERPTITATLGSPVGHRELLSTFLFPIRDLLSFAVSSPAYLESVVLRGPRAIRTSSSGKKHALDIELGHTLLQPRDEDRDLDRLYPNRMLFALADWPNSFSELIQRWLDLRVRHESSLNLLMGLLYAPPRWQATRVLTLVQALEAYHRQQFIGSPANAAATERKNRVLKALDASALDANDRGWLSQRLDHAEEPALWKRFREATDRVAAMSAPHPGR